MLKQIFTIISGGLILTASAFADAPRIDKGKYINYENAFWKDITNSIDKFETKAKKEKPKMYMDFSGIDIPKSIDEFTKQWYNEPVSQGSTGTCWCFSTTSFLETEAYKITKNKFKLSEMFTVYWEYVEKAKRFINERGNSAFAEGSQANAVFRIWKQYGCMPIKYYTGLKDGQEFHAHEKMFNEMNSYLQTVKTNNAWNEETAIATIKSILNHYLGVPPTEFEYNGKKLTPLQFMQQETKINPDDYVSFMSLMEKPYNTQQEYEVTDNWWKFDDYYNIPLDEYMNTIKKVLESGYTISIGGDISETGYFPLLNIAMIPSYDIPSEYIDENARQFRFTNGSTTDDHGIHVVGYKKVGSNYWFLIKDSGSGSRNGSSRGYYFYHEDYIKLKMMNFSVNKVAVTELLKKLEVK